VVEGDPNGGDYDVRLYTHKPKPAHVDALWTVSASLRGYSFGSGRTEPRVLKRRRHRYPRISPFVTVLAVYATVGSLARKVHKLLRTQCELF
jgi:hypothetical protein